MELGFLVIGGLFILFLGVFFYVCRYCKEGEERREEKKET